MSNKGFADYDKQKAAFWMAGYLFGQTTKGTAKTLVKYSFRFVRDRYNFIKGVRR